MNLDKTKVLRLCPVYTGVIMFRSCSRDEQGREKMQGNFWHLKHPASGR